MLKRILIIMAAFITVLAAQETITLEHAAGSRIWFEGTSTLHDYTCEAEEFEATLESPGDSPEAVLNNAAFKLKVMIPVLSIKSSKGERMDKKMYKTMKAEKFSDISYQLISVKKSTSNGSVDNFETEGILTIGGVTHIIAIVAEGELNEAGQLCLRGGVALDMTAFDIKPPKMMLGTLRTNKMITVYFDLIMKKQEKQS